MASLFTDARRTEMYQFFNVAFNAAPGLVYLSQLRDAVEAGLSTKDIVNIFTTKSQFLSVYPSILTNLDFANRLVNNVIKDSASTVAKNEAVNDIVASLNLGLSRGDVIFEVFRNLANITDPGNRYFFVAQQFQKQLIVARYYTEALLGNAEDVLTLQRVIRNVTNNSDVSTDAAIQNLINGGTSGANANLMVAAQAPSINEGTTTFFSITGADANTDLSFTISGVQSADILGGRLTGTVRSDSNGNAFVNVGILNDNSTEGTETLTFTVAGKSASTNIVDTSRGNNTAPVAPAFTNQAAENGPVITGAVVATDANGDALTYSLVTPVPGLVLNSNGTYSFNPAANPSAQALRYSDPAAQIVANYSVSDGQVSTAGTLTITVTPAPLTFVFTQSATSSEGSPAAFVVTASEDLTSSITVQFTVNPGSPSGANGGTGLTNNADFTPGTLQQSITIPAGSRTATFNVTPSADAVSEQPETYTVSAVVNGTTLMAASGTVTDAAAPQTFTLTASLVGGRFVTEGETGSNMLMYTLSLDKDPTSAVTFNVSTITPTGVAADASDFSLLTNTITFAQNQRTITVPLVSINDDATPEPGENLTVQISGAALPTPLNLPITIIDNDTGNNSTLTTNADNFVGTGNTDNFTGVVSALVTAATFTSTDRIDGAGGNDMLSLRMDSDFPGALGQPFPANPTGTQGFVRSVETLALTNGGNAARTFNAANITGVTAIQWTNSSTANGSLNVQNLGQAITSLTVNGLTGANNNVTLGHLAAADTAANTLAVALNSVGTVTAGTTAAIPVAVNSTGVTVERANLTVTGNNALNLSGTGAVGTNTITVAGSGNLELAGATAGAAGTLATLRVFDASTATGSVSAVLAGTNITTVRGGTGNDNITVVTAALQANATLSGGDGDDRLVLSAISGNIAPTLTGFETLEVRSIGAASAIAGAAGSGGVKTVVLNNVTTANPLNLTGIFDAAGVTVQTQGANATVLNSDNAGTAAFRTVAATAATAAAPSVVTSVVNFSQASGAATVEVGANTTFGSATAGEIAFARASGLTINAAGQLGNSTGTGAVDISAAEASTVSLTTAASPAATPLADFVVVNTPKATTLNVSANRNLDIQGSNLAAVQNATIDTAGVLTGTGVNLGAIATLTLTGSPTTSRAILGNLGSSAQTYSANVTANGLEAGLTLGQIQSGVDVNVNLNGLAGAATIAGIAAAGKATLSLLGRPSLVTVTGTVSGASVEIDASGSVAGVRINNGATAGADVTAKDSVVYRGSSLAASAFDVQAAVGSTALNVSLNSGLDKDAFTITGVTGQTGITVTGDLGLDADTLSVVSSATSVAQTISLAGLSNVEQTTITGGSGNDLITGSSGNDSITGGLGNDVINAGAGTNTVTDAGIGADRITHNAASSTVMVTVMGGSEVTVVASQAGASSTSSVSSRVNASISTAGVTLTGSGSDDTLQGGLSSDLISGGAGNDLILNTAVNNPPLGVNDTLQGGGGNDVFAFTSADSISTTFADIIDGGEGTDVLRLDQVGAISYTADKSFLNLTSIEVLQISQAAVNGYQFTLNSTAFAAGIRTVDLSADTLVSGNNLIDISLNTNASIGLVLIGSVGNDEIFGGSGNDTVMAGAGDDLIGGGSGDDSITGGAGADGLAGGAGNDTIDLADGAVAATDTVVFANTAANNGQDIITGFDFAALGGDVLNVRAFLGVPIDTNNGATLGVSIARLDLTGTNPANVAQLNNMQNLTSTNFGSAAMPTVIKTAANSKYFVIANANDADAFQNLYFVQTDANNMATVTLVGTVNEGTLSTANLA